MNSKEKIFCMLAGLLMSGSALFAQATLESTTGTAGNGAYSLTVTGSGNGPRTTPHVITLVQDVLNNNNFSLYSPAVTATVSLRNQQFTGLTYGQGTSNALTTGLVFGAGPTLSTGGTIQQAAPFNSYDLLGATYDAVGAPKNSMFTANPTATGLQLGTGIDADGSAFGNDVNAGVEVFTAAQVLFDNNAVYDSSTRHYFGELVIDFNRFVIDPVIHIAALGASYRYLPAGVLNLPANYKSSYYTTELDLQGAYTASLLSGNAFVSVVGGKKIVNIAAQPASGSSANAPGALFNDFGAATGSVRINGAVKSVVFKIYMRGSNKSDFAWSSAGVGTVTSATRSPFTGDVWYVGVSLLPAQLAGLPATGFSLTASMSNNDVLLNWKTQSEDQSLRFELERSNDGVNFNRIDTKAAAGNSTTERTYSLVDANMKSSICYYRLKLVDIDGKFTYSNVVTVRKPGTSKGIRIFPNPAINQLNLECINLRGNYMVNLYNQAGQEVSAFRVKISNSTEFIKVNRNNLAAGHYMLQIRNTETGQVEVAEKVLFQ
jgi:Secretion system C-terminal sorting domain